MTVRTVWERWWRIPVVALLCAVLAFAGSFMVSPTYESSTRLLIHGQDITVLSSSGVSQPGQNTLLDSSRASVLADTYGNIATSRAVAGSVVDQLGLDRAGAGDGLLDYLAGGFSWLYRCTKAVLTSGFCASGDPRENAITRVQEGTVATQLGSTAGSSAGTPASFVLEITGSGTTAEQAQQITDALADELVSTSSQMSADSASAYVTQLEGQLSAADQQVQQATDAVTAFQTQNQVSQADMQLVSAASAYDQLQTDLDTAQTDLADAQARASAIGASLTSTPRTVDSGQDIATGRSDTSVTTTQTNPVYSDLLTQQNQAAAQVAGLQARIQTLEGQIAAGSPTSLSGVLAQLRDLQNDLDQRTTERDTISSTLSDARTQSATAAPELTRIDTAGLPVYPTSPKRYLYLVIGLVLGGLAGAWLGRRTTAVDETDVDGEPDEDAELEPVTSGAAPGAEDDPTRQVGAPAPRPVRIPAPFGTGTLAEPAGATVAGQHADGVADHTANGHRP